MGLTSSLEAIDATRGARAVCDRSPLAKAVLALALQAVLHWLSMKLFTAGRSFRRHFCLALALVNLALGYRSALATFVTVAPGTLALDHDFLGGFRQTSARDRKPKPTRQMLSTAAERLAREKPGGRDPFDPASGSIAAQAPLAVACVPPLREGQARMLAARAEPEYLRPFEAVLHGQLPPPL